MTGMALHECKLLFGDGPNPRDHAFQILPPPVNTSPWFCMTLESQDYVLSDPDLVKELGKSDLWFADGTFAVVSQMYYQLYTLHCRVGTSYPPCLYTLLPKKQELTYNRFLNILAQHLLPTAVPCSILLDFEMAALNSFCQSFPQSQLQGCYFLLNQRLI